MDFWDGMKPIFMMPSITLRGTSTHSHYRSVVRTESCGVVGVGRRQSQQTQSVTWFSFAFQSKQPSGTQWPATSNNSSCYTR